MNTENGALSFDAVINNEKLIGAINESEKRVKGFSDAVVKEGDKIDDAFKITAENIRIQKDVIASLEGEVKRLNAEIDKLAPGNAQLELKQQAAQVAAELKAEKDALVMLEAEVKKTEQSHVSFRTQLRNAREELIRMEQAGLRGTDAYQQLQNKLGTLKDAMDDVQAQANVLANDERGFQGVVSMVSGLTGAFSAAQGAVGLFAGENENLQKIMLKVQSLMAITIGLQQVAEMLNKDSYFSIVILTKAKELLTVAELKFATAMGISTAAARVLMATLTLGLSVAITAIIVALSKLSSKTAEAKKQQEEFNKAVAESAAEPVAALQRLSTAWNALGNNLQAKQRFVEENKKEFDKLGLSINNVNDAEKVLSDPATLAKLQQAFIFRAKAMAAVEIASKKYQEAIQKQLEMDGTDRYVTKGMAVGAENRKYRKLKEQKETLEAEANNLFTMAAKFDQQGQTILSTFAGTAQKATAGTIAAVEDAIKQLREKYREAATDSERDLILKEIQQQERLLDRMDKTRNQSQPKAPKEEKIKVIEIDETQFEVAEDETLKLYNELLEIYKNYEQRKQAINADFDKKRSVATLMKNDELLDELNKAEKKALEDLEKEVLGENGVGLVDLYFAGSGTAFIQAKIKEVMPLFDNLAYLTNNELDKLKGIIDDISFTPEQIELFKQAGINVEKLVEALNKAKDASKEAVDEQDWKNVIDLANKLAGSLGELGDALQGIGGGVGEIGAALSGISGQIGNVSTMFSDKATKGDIISAGISGLASLVGMIAGQIKANKEAQEEWSAKIRESKHEMEMLNIEASAYREGNIFGVENPYARAIAGAEQYAKVSNSIAKAQNDLMGGQVQTGTKKAVNWGNVGKGVGAGAAVGAAVGSFIPVVGNLLGAGIGALVGGIAGLISTKTVPVFQNLKDKYGEVFDSSGNLNKAILADYDKMDDATKQLIDNWKELKAEQEEAEKQMRENFADLAGDIGKSLSDALVDAFKNDELYSAIGTFDKKMNDVIANIMTQLLFNKVFGKMLDDLEKDFNNSFNGENADGDITDDLMKFNEKWKEGISLFDYGMQDIDKFLKGSGFAGLTGGANNTALSGAIQNVSEETASIISGQLNAIRINQIESVDVMRNQLMELSKISSNTSYNVNLTKLNEILIVLKSIQSGDSLRSQGL